MKKAQLQSNPAVNQIFEDLEKYKDFCVEYGYVFDESSLYDSKNYVYRQHIKQLQGKKPKDNWVEDRVV